MTEATPKPAAEKHQTPGAGAAPTPARKRRRRLLWAALAVGLLIGIIAGLIIPLTSGSQLEQWVGNQLKLLIGSYLNPQFEWDTFDYQAPYTVKLTGVSLSEDDPASPGARVDILRVKAMTITLAEIPRVGRPIVIKEILLEQPEIRAVAAGGEQGGFVGFSNLVKSDGKPPSETPEAPAEPVKLSDYFQMRLISISDGRIVYDARQEGSQPMVIDGITTKLTVEPQKDQAGWYALNTDIQRAPLFSLDVIGRINIDTFTADFEKLAVNLRVDRENDSALPPQLQGLVRQHELTGDLSVNIAGTVHLNEWQTSELTANASLADGYIELGGYKTPIQDLQVKAVVKDRLAKLETCRIDLLEGNITVTPMQVSLDGDMPGRGEVHVEDLRIEQFLVDDEGEESKHMRGLLTANLNLTTSAAPDLNAIVGNGAIRIREGYLGPVPVIRQMEQVMKIARSAAGLEASDTADIEFNISDGVINLTRTEVKTSAMMVRGEGTIGMDTKLDISLNGGPMERVQAMLGGAGKVFGAITDRLSKIRVTGTIAEPKVGLAVGPIGP